MNGLGVTLAAVGALALGARLTAGVARPSPVGGPLYAGGDYGALRELAYAIKVPGSPRLVEAAACIAARVPQRARGHHVVLVPVPSSRGDTDASRQLAEALAACLGATVVDALAGAERQSSRARKKIGLPGLRAQQMPMTLRAQRQIDLADSVYLVDNVLDTGETLRAAERALGRPAGAMVLAVTEVPTGSRDLGAPTEAMKEAQALARWFVPQARAWRAEDLDRGDGEYIGLDDVGFTAEARQDALRARFGDRLLGYGVFRAVVASSDPGLVIKLAMRPSDNLDEAAFWADAGPKTRAMLVPVRAVDPEGHWLLMERVTPLPWEPEDSPSLREVYRRAKEVGLFDIHADNLSADLRILDYAEPVRSQGTPNLRRAPR